jgi:hypothetical protein
MSAFITEEQLKKLYDYATEKSHDAFAIDATKGRPVFKKNFDSILKIVEDSCGIIALFHLIKFAFTLSAIALLCNISCDDLYNVESNESLCLYFRSLFSCL